MRKTLLTLIFLLVLSILAAAPVDFETAQTLAYNWLNRQNELRNTDVEIVKESSYIHEIDERVIFYVFNFEPEGFVIVAGNNASVPILGYNIKGTGSLSDIPDNTASYFRMYEDYILEIYEKNLSNEETIEEWQAILDNEITVPRDRQSVPPLLLTKWNQGYPWNEACPADPSGPGGHVFAGCVAVAMAQVMKFWAHPIQGIGSNSYYHNYYGLLSADFGAATYYWEDMHNFASTPSTAELLFHLGVSVNMNYGPNGSGAWSQDARDALVDHFVYHSDAQFLWKSDYSDAHWVNMLKDQLDNNQPLYYQGYNSQHTGGHAFNCDGYDENDYFHFNWGWGGSFDGFFHINNLNPGNSNFSHLQAAIFDLYPAGPYSFPPTNLTAVPGDESVYLTWDAPVSMRGAENSDPAGQPETINRTLQGYNVYRDGELINSTLVIDTEYEDNEVINNYTYEYYVTAYYDEGESLPSNTVSVIPSIAEPPLAGEGSGSSPYEIASLENLYWIAMYPARWDYHFVQTADIDLSDTVNWFDGQGWRPIGNNTIGFTGSYDGQDYVISGLYINRSGTSDVGLFGSTIGSTIKNVGLTDIDVTGYNSTGGLIGSTYNTVILNSYTAGNVNGTGNFTGSIVGSNRNSGITNCYSTGSVNSTRNFTGSLVGFNRESTINRSYSIAGVNGEISVGGLVGLNFHSVINNSYSMGNVSGVSNAGGLVGFNVNSTVLNSYSAGTITGENNTGGLVGGENNSEVGRSYWNIETSGQDASAGGEGRTTEEMTFPYTANTYVEWDFVDIWGADENYLMNDLYPYLLDVTVPVSAEEDVLAIPEAVTLSNYPNPFNPETLIEFSLVDQSEVKLYIYNIRGRKVKTLLDEMRGSGQHRVVWDGRAEDGREVASGVYLYQLVTEEKSIIRKMMLLK